MSDTLRSAFLEGMSRAATTVSIVTTDGPGGRAGVTVSAMTSVSADGPAPTILTCINASSSAAAPLLTNGVFCINVLKDSDQHLANVFASRVDTNTGDKFDACAFDVLATGAPVLAPALVAFDCKLISADLVGTHHVAIGAVQQMRVADGTPLIYGMRSYLRAERA